MNDKLVLHFSGKKVILAKNSSHYGRLFVIMDKHTNRFFTCMRNYILYRANAKFKGGFL
ncbi:hypothetical protein GCM10028868_01490 [Virgibacillus kimchii]